MFSILRFAKFISISKFHYQETNSIILVKDFINMSYAPTNSYRDWGRSEI